MKRVIRAKRLEVWRGWRSLMPRAPEERAGVGSVGEGGAAGKARDEERQQQQPPCKP